MLCPVDADDFLMAKHELESDQLVAEVLRRNPSLQAMIMAWQAAAQRYPQVVSLEDPMLSLAMGPGTFGDPNHDVAWMVEGSQKIPWCGKRELRGRQAQAEASAAHWDVDDAELQLVESTKLALLDDYLVRRDLELNAEALRLAQGFRETADSHYRNNLVTQQDILQADLELSELRRRQFELERMDRVAAARINTLLHRPADSACHRRRAACLTSSLRRRLRPPNSSPPSTARRDGSRGVCGRSKRPSRSPSATIILI